MYISPKIMSTNFSCI